jgi:hypothetical protein
MMNPDLAAIRRAAFRTAATSRTAGFVGVLTCIG